MPIPNTQHPIAFQRFVIFKQVMLIVEFKFDLPTDNSRLFTNPRRRRRLSNAERGVMATAQGHDSTQEVAGSGEGLLKVIMALRGLDISTESKFDFTLPSACKEWPAPHYGPDSPHSQHAKKTSSLRRKRRTSASVSSRPGKARKPRDTPTKKAKPEPSREHGPIPKREIPLHLLNLPGELRDMIYDLLALQDEPVYPQYRHVYRSNLHRRGNHKVIRRYPQEPTLARVNHQLQREVLSYFYGANTFVFQRSEEPLLQNYSMTDPVWLTKFHGNCASSAYLRMIELRFEIRTREKPLTLTYELERTGDGQIHMKHDLARTDNCHCLEDGAVAETMVHASMHGELMQVAVLLSRRRKESLAALAKRDKGADGLFRMPTARCLYCRKEHLIFVSAG